MKNEGEGTENENKLVAVPNGMTIVRFPKKVGLERMLDPFTPNQIGKLPKPSVKEGQSQNCKVCGGYHRMPAAHLDYVGHAAITSRLLEADPLWNWKPLAFQQNGLPQFDSDGGLWIELTVAGHSRLGYGSANGKTGGDATKEIIGDALRNAAMRFGAGLEMWHKGDLYEREVANGNLEQDKKKYLIEKPVDEEELKRLREACALGLKTTNTVALRDLWELNLESLDREFPLDDEKPNEKTTLRFEFVLQAQVIASANQE